MNFFMSALLLGSPASADSLTPHIAVDSTSISARIAPSGKAAIYQIAGEKEGAKNAFFGVLEIQPGVKVPLHRDSTEEYLYVTQGQGTLTIDGKTTKIKAGFGVFMPANAEVSFEATGTEIIRVVQFFAGPEPAVKYEQWTPTTD